jgi:hypothetical protein
VKYGALCGAIWHDLEARKPLVNYKQCKEQNDTPDICSSKKQTALSGGIQQSFG